jgi:hypothetical protein
VLHFVVGAIGTALAAPVLEGLGRRGACLIALIALVLAGLVGHTSTRQARQPASAERLDCT